MDTIAAADKILAILVVLTQILMALVILYWFLLRKKHPKIANFLSKKAVLFSLVVALTATLGSLFYSNVAGFNPCVLCWYQRIFMYPQVVLLGLALWKNKNEVIDYSLALAVAGWVISAYHNYIFYKSISSNFCKIGESCLTNYTMEFGYITIPMMALTAFTLIILLLVSKKLI